MSAQHDSQPSDAPLLPSRELSAYISGYMLEVFLYGINALLFVIAVSILLAKNEGFPRRALLVTATLMFLLATSSVALSMYLAFHDLIPGLVSSSTVMIVRTKHTLFFINNMTADGLLIYRCYAVWSRSLYVIAAPSTLLIATTIYGAISMPGPLEEVTDSKEHIFLWLTLTLNVSVTTLIATRIWWIAREVQKLLGQHYVKKHYSLMATTIETGAIYSVYILVYQILGGLGIHWFILDIGLSQMTVVAPLLIIVQTGLGRHIRDVETTLLQDNTSSNMILTTVHNSI